MGVASGVSPVAVGRTGLTPGATGVSGINFANAEVEPVAAIHPANPKLLLAAWQQDRWSNGGARALVSAVSSDGGANWEPVRVIYTPAPAAGAGSSQTIGNRIVVPTAGVARGVLVNVFLQIDTVAGNQTSRVAVNRSSDRGLTWAVPVFIAEQRTGGNRDALTGQSIRDGGIIPNIAAGPATLLADVWMLTSRDGATWAETRVSSTSLDASQAP